MCLVMDVSGANLLGGAACSLYLWDISGNNRMLLELFNRRGLK